MRRDSMVMKKYARLILLLVAVTILLKGELFAQVVPENAYAYGDRWYCNNGFKQASTKCESGANCSPGAQFLGLPTA
jgi:hypothetical protein